VAFTGEQREKKRKQGSKHGREAVATCLLVMIHVRARGGLGLQLWVVWASTQLVNSAFNLSFIFSLFFFFFYLSD